jgi:hypothetical protein
MGRRVWKPEDGVLGALEMLDAPGEYAVDRVPTVDADVPLATYRDWDPKDTRIVTCRIGNDLYPRDERFESRDEAYKAVERRHGRILEANYAPGRAFFRVRRK